MADSTESPTTSVPGWEHGDDRLEVVGPHDLGRGADLTRGRRGGDEALHLRDLSVGCRRRSTVVVFCSRERSAALLVAATVDSVYPPAEIRQAMTTTPTKCTTGRSCLRRAAISGGSNWMRIATDHEAMILDDRDVHAALPRASPSATVRVFDGVLQPPANVRRSCRGSTAVEGLVREDRDRVSSASVVLKLPRWAPPPERSTRSMC